MEEFFNEMIQTFLQWMPTIRTVFLVISVFLLGFIIFALIRTTWLKRLFVWNMQEFLSVKPFGVKNLSKPWQKIKARTESGLESEYKLAVIEADSLLDESLKRRGFNGETFGEKVEKLTDATIPNLNELLEAHKVRNSIVHDPAYKLTIDEVRKVLDIYEESLVELQAL
jgi:hypothetical protein